MSQPPPVNTLIDYAPYIGHDPRKWKYINFRDSNTYKQDFYSVEIDDEEYQQYDLISGQSIMVFDNI